MLGSFRMAVGGNLKGIICNIPAKLDLVGSAMFIDDNLCLFVQRIHTFSRAVVWQIQPPLGVPLNVLFPLLRPGLNFHGLGPI